MSLLETKGFGNDYGQILTHSLSRLLFMPRLFLGEPSLLCGIQTVTLKVTRNPTQQYIQADFVIVPSIAIYKPIHEKC